MAINKRDAILILIIAALLILLLHTCDSAKRTERTLESELGSVQIWRDKFGRSNAELTVTKLDYQSLKKYHSNVVDSLRKQLGIKPKSVTNVVTVGSVISDTVFITTGKPSVSKWATFKLDSNKLVYSIRDSLVLVTYNKRYGFLNLKTKYTTRVVSFNPHSTITGLTSIEIIPKERRLHLGLYAGYGMQLNQGVVRVGPSVGLGITMKIF